MKTRSQCNATIKYDKNNYYRKLLLIPKSIEEDVKNKASSENKSVNKYILDLVIKDIGMKNEI